MWLLIFDCNFILIMYYVNKVSIAEDICLSGCFFYII